MIEIKEVNSENWRNVCALRINDDQNDFVNDAAYSLNLCHYGGDWHPLAVYLSGNVIGFLMWAIDSDDQSCWLGGIIIDKDSQGKGYGKEAIERTLQKLKEEQNPASFSLSYAPENPARRLYKKIGFIETSEMEDDEIVARLKL